MPSLKLEGVKWSVDLEASRLGAISERWQNTEREVYANYISLVAASETSLPLDTEHQFTSALARIRVSSPEISHSSTKNEDLTFRLAPLSTENSTMHGEHQVTHSKATNNTK